jgi:hypothetical protein
VDSENVVRAGDVSSEKPVPQAKGISCEEDDGDDNRIGMAANHPTPTVVLWKTAVVGAASARALR